MTVLRLFAAALVIESGWVMTERTGLTLFLFMLAVASLLYLAAPHLP